MEICIHCDEAAIPPLYLPGDTGKSRPFCCEGCLTVYEVLHEKGLESYYEIKNNSSIFRRRAPVVQGASEFKFLDEAEFLKEFSYSSGELPTMEFYLEGIHCLACLWLVEKLPEFLPGVLSSKLDLERSVATVVLSEGGKFSAAAKEFAQLGYRPHPLRKNQEAAEFKKKEERTFLLRIGIAGAAAGNIMIYAVSLYGGASGEFARLFNALTVAFALPVLTFSAYPFYKNAWSALRNRTLSIDIPISLSLLLGIVMGIYNLFNGIPDNYFDSLTALVFLLLLSRYFLQKIQEKGLSASDLHFFYQSDSVLLSDGREVHPKFVKVDDVLRVRAGEFLPVDGVILEGHSHFNNSLLTGESLPVSMEEGDKVHSGTQNLDHELLVKVTASAQDSRLGRILRNVENGWAGRSRTVTITTIISKYFTLGVFILSAILFTRLYLKEGMKEALEGAMTLLIVTCPCALALAVPLTFTRSLSKASKHGIIIKSDEVLEKTAKVKHVFLDKTGTITHGKLKVVNFVSLKTSLIPVEQVIQSLESRSRHPVAQALLSFAKPLAPMVLAVGDFKELLGRGVTGVIGGHRYEIMKNMILEDGEVIATYETEDVVREDSASVLASLARMGLGVSILSGDSATAVGKVSLQVGLLKESALHGLSPEEKCLRIESSRDSLMVGDGANDAIALGRASVGVAVLGAMEISLRAADIYLTTPGLSGVEKTLILSRETMKVIKRNLVLSLMYNSFSVAAAFLGLIGPLVAAVIMPLSSLTVLLSTLVGTKEMRRLWK